MVLKSSSSSNISLSDLDEITAIIIERARKSGMALQGPVDTEYGFGWDPTTTVWIENRRVHWYYNMFDSQFIDEKLSLIIEVAEVNEKRYVLRGITQSADHLFSVVELFLQQRVSFATLEVTLPDLRWRCDEYDQDKFIPHPPNKTNTRNTC